MSSIFVKFLTYQPTGHVVWMKYVPLGLESFDQYIPNVDRTLDYKSYYGTNTEKINLLKALNNYTLICPGAGSSIGIKELPENHRSAVRLARVKCIAAILSYNMIKFQSEKFNAKTGPWANNPSSEIMAKVVINNQGIPVTDAMKLVEFKQREIKLVSDYIDSMRFDAELRLINATTTDEVIDQFELIKVYSMVSTSIDLKTVV